MNFSGTWRNERGSSMIIDHQGTRVVGTYHTGVGDPTDSEGFPLVGWATETRIVFSVDFSQYGSLTSWTGYVEGGEIVTLWHLARRPEEGEDWASVRAGGSRFKPVP